MATETPNNMSCCSPRALFGWSPPALSADTPLKRAVDRVLPSTGVSLLICFGAVVGLLLVAPFFPKPIELVLDGLAALVAGSWCALNFWRSRHAHCVVTGVGWLGLAPFTFLEAAVGRSLIGGNEQLVFLAVLAVGLGFEAAWYVRLRTNAVLRSGHL
jgi:hypothetical protein